ncbi:MAG: hypothetical protein EHM84_01900 [Lysobacterales bacterium]|jgi:hypothetical protein|nr:MAG: hypothetical protein EHM84_01900 [Xanthomonadales bacterium]
MRPQPDIRAEAALYWAAVSLIVCEGLSIDKAAERLGVDDERLRSILHRRQSLRPFQETSRPPDNLIRLFDR